MKLYLGRHGEYVAHGIQGIGFLSDKGKHDIEQIANFLRPLKITVANIYHSGKPRAEQTADILAAGFISPNAIASYSGINPEDDVTDFAEDIKHWNEDTLIVGHLPFLARLAGKLLIDDENKEMIIFQPGTIACLERLDHTKWVMNWIIGTDLIK